MINNTLLILSSLNVTVCETEDCKNVGILEDDPNDNDSTALSIERKWYNACMDEERLQKKGYKPVTKYLQNIGGWPMIMKPTEWKEEEFPWQKVAQYYARISGKYSLFTISQFLNPNNTENKILMFDKLDGIQLLWSYEDTEYDDDDDDDDDDDVDYDNDVDYTNLKFGRRNSYENSYESKYDDNDYNDDSYDESYDDEDYDEGELITSIIEDYAKSVKGNVKNIRDQVNEILDFQEALHNLLIEIRYDEPKDKKTVMTIGEFQKLYDSYEPGNSTAKIDWLEMIHALSNNSGTYIDESEKILLFRKSFFEKLVPILKETPNRVIVNIIHWVFFRDALIYLGKDKRPWYEDIDGEYRSEYCIAHMMGLYFNTGFSKVYIDNYFSDDIKEYASEIAEDVRNQVKSDILTSNWLDNEAKQLINDKLESMKFHIGYPDYYKNKTFLNQIYDGLKVGPNYFDNVINMLTFDNNDFWREFREPFDKDQFLENPTVLNAFYNEYDNSITIPAAELMVPLFNSTMPLSVKYGYLGFTVGHEINHGFDNDGRTYNKDGNQLPWLAEELINKYVNNAKCFINQFDDYGVNGSLTQNENIADCAGLKSAFQAYKNKMKSGNYQDIRLPGLNGLSGDQLFFVSFAASLCTNISPEFEEYLMKNNEHSVQPYRVNGAVSNLNEFSNAFHCSESSPMHPKNKCKLWK
ncbi:endothelin-converting enzyme 1-like isoform X2 [Leptopilina boulardi]|uniref:endothelin-converting enzyme 1-like isoform X2 n=1 Tax=Leptopilina boulardi TaxID=63433 RepID=UPI0021F64183|nr:endothelin-converting enzyme 1-like isoform X2 [Leptopilina boulardi]